MAEKIVTESLDNAISDLAKVTKVKVSKNKASKVAVLATPPSNLIEVAEVQVLSLPEMISHETIVEVEPVKVVTVEPAKAEKTRKKSKTTKAKNESKATQKGNKINGFFGSRAKNVSRETLKSEAKTQKLTKSPYWSKSSKRKASSGGNNLMGRIFNVYNIYKKNAMTGVLALMMLGFVTATTYVTYAYVTSRDADLIGNVAKHVLLPETEQPKVYIVQSEKADLFTNPLFAGIQVGDNVLTYTKAGKVIIYRSSEDKVVNIVNLK